MGWGDEAALGHGELGPQRGADYVATVARLDPGGGGEHGSEQQVAALPEADESEGKALGARRAGAAMYKAGGQGRAGQE